MSMRGSRRRVTRSCLRHVGVAAVAALVAGATSACTGAKVPTPRPTVEGPSFTTIPDGGGTVTVDRLEPPAQSPADVTRLLVSSADGLFWSGTSEPGRASPARAGQRYRLTGRCLPATTGGTLVVDVLGPGQGGSAGAPSRPMSGPRVATLTVPCDGTEVRLDLRSLPAGSGELMVTEATSQVAMGWVVLAGSA